MMNAVTTATRVRILSAASSQLCTAGLGIVLLDGVAKVAQDLAAGEVLGLHALHPLLLHRLELDPPALTLLRGHHVDGRPRLLGRLDPVVLVAVPVGAGDLGAPGAAQVVDALAQL